MIVGSSWPLGAPPRECIAKDLARIVSGGYGSWVIETSSVRRSFNPANYEQGLALISGIIREEPLVWAAVVA
jgi:hypothetical protein